MTSTRSSGSKIVTAVAYGRAKPGQEEELGRRMLDLIAPTIVEPGCINYDLYRSNADPALWMFIENWRSQEDLDAHMQSEHFQRFFATKDDVLIGTTEKFQLSLVFPSSAIAVGPKR
jgi:quinol monooxygenase YgiN